MVVRGICYVLGSPQGPLHAGAAFFPVLSLHPWLVPPQRGASPLPCSRHRRFQNKGLRARADRLSFLFCWDLITVLSSSLFFSTWKLYSSFSWFSW